MTNEEFKAEKNESAVEAGSEQTNAADRRSFIKTVVAGAVAAGAIGAVPLVARAQEGQMAERLATASATRRFRISFNGRRPPTLDDIYRALEQAAGEAGCTRCGLLGYDIYMGCQDIIQPVEAPYVVTGEQQFGF